MSTITKAGRYDLREELGRGAMGVVYHGFDPTIGRDVAVKTLHLSGAGTGMSHEELIVRFQTEARAAGLLTHPNIVVVFDAGEEEGLFYITMEFVEGRSLQSHLDGHQLFPLPRVLRLMEQICSALDFAHQHNVVHRDIKPANLMLTQDDTVKITDFGTAKILQIGTAQTAHVMGTPSYMSPEQVKGKPIDGRSDIFSLGVILYELLTGEKPFPGQNITTVIYKIINEEPIPPRSLDSSIHPGLSAVITKALAKEPAERFQSCHELMTALKNYHDLVGPNATMRIAPASSQSAPRANRVAAPPAALTAPPLVLAPIVQERPARSRSSITHTEEAPKRSGSIFLTLILLGLIGFAGYRLYPNMRDLWQRAHEPAEKLPTQAKAESAPPANLDGQVVKPDVQSQVSGPPLASPNAIVAPAVNAVPQRAPYQPAVLPATQVKTPETLPPPVNNTEKSIAPQKADASTSSSTPRLFESKLRAELQGRPLADKVNIQATANALTLTGSLTLAEHRELLRHLRTVPAGVRVIDDIEFADDQKAASAPVNIGWIWVRSAPRGARILVDGAETGLRTPARLELQAGQHEVRLVRFGFSPAHRTVAVEAGQTMQFAESLETVGIE